MLPQGDAARILMEHFEEDAALGGVVVLQPGQREDRWPDVSVVGPHAAGCAVVSYTWAHKPEPGGDDLWLDITMVPGKTRADADTTRAAGGTTVEEEVVGVGEPCERWRARRVGRDHVQQLHLDRIRQRRRESDGITRARVDGGELAGRPLANSGHRSVARRGAVDSDGLS